MPRWLEVLLVIAAFPLWAPLAAISALAVLCTSGRPVLFRQERLGLGGATLLITKFRTMTDERYENGQLLEDEHRVTAAGRLLRRYRLDELPSFFKVLEGSLSLVGPRPLPPTNYSDRPEAAKRLAVRPGFSGLAQVSGNTRLSVDEKLAVDMHYISNRTCFLDLKILLRTVKTIIKGEDRNEDLILDALRSAADHEQQSI